MRQHTFCAAAAAALLVFSASAVAQSGSTIRSDPGLLPPSTGTSSDAAGTRGTTAPRSESAAPSTSVGISGANRGAGATESTGRCDTLIGEERIRCLREQAAAGTAGSGSAGAGSTGMGSAAGGSPSVGGGATPGAGR